MPQPVHRLATGFELSSRADGPASDGTCVDCVLTVSTISWQIIAKQLEARINAQERSPRRTIMSLIEACFGYQGTHQPRWMVSELGGDRIRVPETEGGFQQIRCWFRRLPWTRICAVTSFTICRHKSDSHSREIYSGNEEQDRGRTAHRMGKHWSEGPCTRLLYP